MKNYNLLKQRLEEGIKFLEQQQTKLMPVIDVLTEMALDKIKRETLSFTEVMAIYNQLMEQQTNSIMLLTKIKEIIDYTEMTKDS